jgi:hypothetical protein
VKDMQRNCVEGRQILVEMMTGLFYCSKPSILCPSSLFGCTSLSFPLMRRDGFCLYSLYHKRNQAEASRLGNFLPLQRPRPSHRPVLRSARAENRGPGDVIAATASDIAPPHLAGLGRHQ